MHLHSRLMTQNSAAGRKDRRLVPASLYTLPGRRMRNRPMRRGPVRRGPQRRGPAIERHLLACATALLLCLGLPAVGFSEQLDTDLICGVTVSQSGYSDADVPDITAANAIVVGQDGTVYYERDADEQVQIASITKVMTAIVALENAELDDTITVDYEAATVGQSSAYLQEGDTLTLEAALRALLIASGNDAGVAIAKSVGALIDPESDDPYQVFVDAMNAKAVELGMENTLFANPHGLDFDEWADDMYSSARDVATMLAYAMQFDAFRTIVASEDNTISVTGASGTARTLTLAAHNEVLGESNNIGGKTGTTNLAGQCFAGAFSDEDGDEVYTVVLGCEENDDRWADTLELADWYYDHVVEVPLVNTSATRGDAAVLASVGLASWTDKTVDATLEDTDLTVSVFALAGDITQTVELLELEGTVESGDAVGTITFEQNGQVLAEETLVAVQTVEGPSLFESIMVRLDRLLRSFSGEAAMAESTVYNEVPDPLDYVTAG